MASNYQPAPSDMVQQVVSIIQGYGDNGPIRALAQEPVQNSLDAKHNSPIVRVEYRLHERRDANGDAYHVLTVTDSGTHGLRGPALTQEQLQERGYELGTEENWAAFEGQGFTRKSDDTAGGKRGQGKSAFLYHSNPPMAARNRRMMMLYDSVRGDDLYRLGVRNANPADTIQTPPWENGAALERIQAHFTDETGIDLDLGLERLTNVGTRVIVPYLSDEAVTAFRNGELVAWLQRCWWRAIQTDTLEITVVDDAMGHRETVSVPSWWKDEPWINEPPIGVEIRKFEDIDLSDGLRIKRIVLLYDEALQSADAEGDDAQFEGVQLLRGQQWITTMGSRQHFGGVIPSPRRPGFRGFVEFDQSLEKELRDLETPQHHKFDRMQGIVQTIYRRIERAVEELATELGWRQESGRPPRPTPQPDITRDLLQWLAPNARGPRPTPTPQEWNCLLSVTLPDPKVARVNLGQWLENVHIQITSPSPYPVGVTVSLEARHAEDDLVVPIRQGMTMTFSQRDGDLDLGSFQIVRDANRDDQIELAGQGKWTLVTRVYQDGRQVARSSRAFYLNEDPPNQPPKPLSLSISAENRTRNVTGRERINYREKVALQINARNGTPDQMDTTLNASVGSLLPMLADGTWKNLRGTPTGDTPDRQDIWSGEVIFYPPDEMPLPENGVTVLAVEPGRHLINADLSDINGQVEASTSYRLLIETDARNEDWLPFRVQVGPSDLPRWQLKEVDGELLLLYPDEYATLRSLKTIESDSATSGRNAFLFEITCEALIQWALEPVWNGGDRTNFDELCSGQPTGVELTAWEEFVESLERLERSGGGGSELPFVEVAKNFRECAAQLMRMYEESH